MILLHGATMNLKGPTSYLPCIYSSYFLHNSIVSQNKVKQILHVLKRLLVGEFLGVTNEKEDFFTFHLRYWFILKYLFSISCRQENTTHIQTALNQLHWQKLGQHWYLRYYNLHDQVLMLVIFNMLRTWYFLICERHALWYVQSGAFFGTLIWLAFWWFVVDSRAMCLCRMGGFSAGEQPVIARTPVLISSAAPSVTLASPASASTKRGTSSTAVGTTGPTAASSAVAWYG